MPWQQQHSTRCRAQAAATALWQGLQPTVSRPHGMHMPHAALHVLPENCQQRTCRLEAAAGFPRTPLGGGSGGGGAFLPTLSCPATCGCDTSSASSGAAVGMLARMWAGRRGWTGLVNACPELLEVSGWVLHGCCSGAAACGALPGRGGGGGGGALPERGALVCSPASVGLMPTETGPLGCEGRTGSECAAAAEGDVLAWGPAEAG